jgi:hypothetical protein
MRNINTVPRSVRVGQVASPEPTKYMTLQVISKFQLIVEKGLSDENTCCCLIHLLSLKTLLAYTSKFPIVSDVTGRRGRVELNDLDCLNN